MPIQILNSNGSPEQTYARQQLAAAITAKGVETDPKAPFNVMAENVQRISHESVTIDGGDLYKSQLFGGIDGSTSPLWNLYEVCAELKSRYIGAGYRGFVLGEFFKGYENISLSGADAYVTSDGAFYNYSTTHVWNDFDNKRANRWIAYLYIQQSNFTVTNVNICPRSIFIGGTIDIVDLSFISQGRVSEIVSGIEQDDTILSLKLNLNQNFTNKLLYIRGVRSLSLGGIIRTTAIQCISLECENFIEYSESLIPANYFIGYYRTAASCPCIKYLDECEVIEIPDIETFGGLTTGEVVNSFAKAKLVSMPKLEVIDSKDRSMWNSGYRFISAPILERFYAPKLTELYRLLDFTKAVCLNDIEVGEVKTRLYTRWNPTTVLSTPEGIATINANIRDHIAAKVSDRIGQNALTFTVSINLYNNLEPETIAAFTAKNWNVAGA